MLIIRLSFLAVLLMPGEVSAADDVPKFSGENAYSYLLKQCDFGPRFPGSQGHSLVRDFLVSTLRAYADSVHEDNFSRTLEGVRLDLTNIVASFRPDHTGRLLLCAHWDTRPMADRDPDPGNREKPIIGANDGASGVAILLELARCLSLAPPPVGVDIVLFDGEDYGHRADLSDYFLGSRHFARSRRGSYHPELGILLDMVGDSDLGIYKEGNSYRMLPAEVNMVWRRARELGVEAFRDRVGYSVSDDHLPLIEAGIPCIDVIDFDYPYWHTVEDTPDKCSPESLEAVGKVLVDIIYNWH